MELAKYIGAEEFFASSREIFPATWILYLSALPRETSILTNNFHAAMDAATRGEYDIRFFDDLLAILTSVAKFHSQPRAADEHQDCQEKPDERDKTAILQNQ